MDKLQVQVAKRLGDFRLQVALEVAPGECLALVGPTGCGKTTLLRTIVGTLQPDQGHIALGEQVWFSSTRRLHLPPEARRVGYLPQDYGLFPHLDVLNNVAYGARARGLSRRRAVAVAQELLERLGIASLAHQRPATLSGGQRQRVALARALASQPRVLLLDEPLAALDMQTRGQVRIFLSSFFAEVGLPTIVVSHDPVDALTLGSKIAVMQTGHLIQLGPRHELLRNPRDPFVATLVGLNLFRGQARPLPDGLTQVSCDGLTLYSSDQVEGPTFVVVAPTDVTLSREALEGSALNVLQGRVEAITYLGTTVRVSISVGGEMLSAEITYHSAESLQLRPGQELYGIFKAAATRCVQ
jgi:molybdate transport system ATP-binding protein